jgi:hypothetical protein
LLYLADFAQQIQPGIRDASRDEDFWLHAKTVA